MTQLLLIASLAFTLSHPAFAQTASPTAAAKTAPPAAAASLAPPNPALNGQPITANDKTSLANQYKKAESDEAKALTHQERAQLKELSAAQSSKRHAWRDQERKTRKQYFDLHESGPERRGYVQSYLKRKLAFDNSQSAAFAEMKKGWKAKEDALKKDQKDRDDKFKTSLDQNKRPDAALWPQAH